ncbi:MAG: biotin/lipoate A/B protein ligase [Ignavibacteria bacterium]|nr:MAG: biotin/lipoate A/B protein ligase [Ignavibacteria bacterium]KAF0160430.1 MAG: biotin/lipoate A/B protein ligase [Ignavibacteria bacterium]
MIWHFLDSDFNTGEFNMNKDIELAQNCKSDEAYFRLYRWQPYCISLGANQSFDDIDLAKAKTDGIDVVKRPTGGRAILHAEEMTYSVILPLNYQYSPKEVYSLISTALIRGLDLYDHRLAESELESVQPNFPILLEEASGVLCFASTAKNEVKFGGKKLIGSAQRKLNNIILQHGSILCGTFHQKLADYLNTEAKSKELLRDELSSRTTEIETILNAKVDYGKLKECLVQGFEQEWQIKWK